MRRTAAWLLLVITAAGAGYLAGAGKGEGVGTRAPRPPPTPLASTPRAGGPPAGAPAAATKPAPEPAPAGTTLDGVRALLLKELNETPTDASVNDAARRAERKRQAYIAAVEHAEKEAAREVAEEIRRERAFVEDRARGGTMALVRTLDTRLPELVSDEKRFTSMFERHVAGPAVDGTPKQDQVWPDGATVSYPQGVYDLRFPRAAVTLKDVLVRGSGMDATLVRLTGELDARGDVTSLTFEDLTIDCRDNYLTDLRRAPATIRLARCRVVGFDIGAGGSVMIQASAVAFYATDCRFEAGFGRSPGSGSLFRLQAGLVRLDRCLIRGPFRSLWDSGSRTTYLFCRCDIRDAPAGAESSFTTPPDDVRLVECTFGYLPPGVGAPREPRPLSDINPDWPGR